MKSIQNGELELKKNQVVSTRGSNKKKHITIAMQQTNKDNSEGECGIESVRQKFVIDLKVSVDRMNDTILKNEKEDEWTREIIKRWNPWRRGECDKGK